MIPDEYIQTFIVECRELLEQMEEALLIMLIVKQVSEDPDSINAIFRVTRTIKGSAAMLGIDSVMVFSEAVESVADHARRGDIGMSLQLAAIFIEAYDHLHKLINHVAEGSRPNEETDNHGNVLIEKLESYLNGTAVDQPGNLGEASIFHQAKGEKSIGDCSILAGDEVALIIE